MNGWVEFITSAIMLLGAGTTASLVRNETRPDVRNLYILLTITLVGIVVLLKIVAANAGKQKEVEKLKNDVRAKEKEMEKITSNRDFLYEKYIAFREENKQFQATIHFLSLLLALPKDERNVAILDRIKATNQIESAEGSIDGE